MSVYKRGGKWWIHFQIDGERYRRPAHVKTKSEAVEVENQLRMEKNKRGSIAAGRNKTLTDIVPRFREWMKTARSKSGRELDADTKLYYENGWRLLSGTAVVTMKLNTITKEVAESLRFPGSPYNTNCALRTLRRMLSKAVEWNLIAAAPKITMAEEVGRERVFTPEQEAQFLALAARASKCPRKHRKTEGLRSPLRDVFLCCLDAGMRPEEAFSMRIEDIRWQQKAIFIPRGKTRNSRRYVPMSQRLTDVLFERCGGRSEGWVFPSDSECGHLTTVKTAFNWVRTKMGLGPEYVLYTARHTFGTYLYAATKNLALVMAIMGHGDVKTAMRYQHPELELARTAINNRHAEMAAVLAMTPSMNEVRDVIESKTQPKNGGTICDTVH